MADIEAAKRAAAQEAVRNHFPENPRFVGIGSGTTIVYVVEAIKELGTVDVTRVGFVPTGYQSKQLIINAGLVPIEFDALPDNAMIDVAFDGADEVDEDLNCIKGGGACLYQEKLVAMRAKQFICVAGKVQPARFTPDMLTSCVTRLPETPAPTSDQLAHHPDRGRAQSCQTSDETVSHVGKQNSSRRWPSCPRRTHGQSRAHQDRPRLFHH
jgi:hypothetical protein